MSIFWMIFQLVLLLLLAPLFDGMARKLRAIYQSRVGPPIMQTYRDFLKLYSRARTLPEHASFLFRSTPYVLFAIICTIFCLLPITYGGDSVSSSLSDALLLIYLLAAFRLIFALAGLDSANPYASIASNRELLIALYAEGAFVLSLGVVMLNAQSTNLVEIKALVSSWEVGYFSPSFAVASIAFLWVCYVESGRKPYDIAEAEQELNEGLFAEYSGRDLAFLQASFIMKQFVMIGFFLVVFEPWNFQNPILAMLVFLLEAGIFYIGGVFIDNFTSRFKITTSIKLSSFAATLIAFGCVMLYALGV